MPGLLGIVINSLFITSIPSLSDIFLFLIIISILIKFKNYNKFIIIFF